MKSNTIKHEHLESSTTMTVKLLKTPVLWKSIQNWTNNKMVFYMFICTDDKSVKHLLYKGKE